jgi:acetyl-CoA synthetase
LDYADTFAGFSWDTIRGELQGLPEGRGLNIAHEAVDRHADGGLRDRVALRWLGSEGSTREFTYGELKGQSNRLANILKGLGIGKGDTVSVLAGRIPELYIAALGILKNTSVFCPLFSAFGPEPIYQRLSRGDAKVLVTTERYYRQNAMQTDTSGLLVVPMTLSRHPATWWALSKSKVRSWSTPPLLKRESLASRTRSLGKL